MKQTGISQGVVKRGGQVLPALTPSQYLPFMRSQTFKKQY